MGKYGFHLSEGDQLAEDQPVVDHLGIRCDWQFLHNADEDGCHHKHVGKVHSQGGLEEERLEEGCGKGDHHEENRGEVGRHHFTLYLSLQHNGHLYSIFWLHSILVVKIPVAHVKKCHVTDLLHHQIFGVKQNI